MSEFESGRRSILYRGERPKATDRGKAKGYGRGPKAAEAKGYRTDLDGLVLKAGIPAHDEVPPARPHEWGDLVRVFHDALLARSGAGTTEVRGSDLGGSPQITSPTEQGRLPPTGGRHLVPVVPTLLSRRGIVSGDSRKRTEGYGRGARISPGSAVFRGFRRMTAGSECRGMAECMRWRGTAYGILAGVDAERARFGAGEGIPEFEWAGRIGRTRGGERPCVVSGSRRS